MFKNHLFYLLIVFVFTSKLTFAQLSGINTINPSGTNFSGNPNGVSGKNYTSFKNAVIALRTYGISSQVTFNIDSGSYNEQIVIPPINGASSTNKIIFQSANNDSTSVCIYYSPYYYDSNYVISLQGADYIVLKKLRIEARGNYYSTAIDLRNGADYNLIINCVIGTTKGSGTYFTCISFNSSTIERNNSIVNNYLSGGYCGIYLNPYNSLTSEPCNLISSNSITNFLNCGIFASWQDSLVISFNEIINTGGTSELRGIYTYNCLNSNYIYNNKIILYSQTNCYGIYQYLNNETNIYNNFISVENNSNSYVYGLYFNSSDFQKTYYNSVLVKTAGSSQSNNNAGLYIKGNIPSGRGAEVINNIFANTGGGYAIYVINANLLNFSDYNDYYSTGNYPCYYVNTACDLAKWKSLSSQDMNSISVNPDYFSKTDLHVNNPGLNGKGTFIYTVTKDIDGDSRLSNPDIGADEFTLLNNDVSAYEYILNTSLCSSTNMLQVKIKNFGTDTLKSLILNCEINGIRQNPDTFWSLSLLHGAIYTTNLSILNIVANQFYNIKVWTSLPNGVADQNPKNDTLFINNIRTGLSGEYIIGSAGGDYKTIKDAISELNKYGVCGPVKFRIKAGKYNEQLLINEIKGANSTNNIIIESFDKDSSKVEISYYAYSTIDDYVIKLNGSDFITIQYLTIKAFGTNQAKCIVLDNGADNNTIRNNAIIIPNIYSSGNYYGIFSRPVNINNDYNLIENNLISGGLTSIYYYAYSSTAPEYNNSIKNNQLNNFQNYGIYCFYQLGLNITGNKLESNTTYYGVGIAIYNCNLSTKVSGNIIKVTSLFNGYIGISFINCIGNQNEPIYVFNNFILLINPVDTFLPCYDYGYGVSIYDCQYLYFANNTIRTKASTEYSVPLNISSGSWNKIYNNNLVNEGDGYAVLASPSSAFNTSVCDYNNFYYKGKNLGYCSKDIKNLSTWQSTTRQDSHSIVSTPNFYDEESYHILNTLLDGKAKPLTYVSKDLDNDTRHPQCPDIGADEFTIYGYDVALIKILSPVIPCDSVSSDIVVKLKNVGYAGITSIKFNWSVNNVLQKPKYFSTRLFTNKDSNFLIGSYVFTKGGQYRLKVWIDTINNYKDMYAKNDTLSTLLTVGMSGSYTIGKSGKDFSTISEAINALQYYGICGKVVFNIEPGTYKEQLLITNVRGASATNTITFQSSTLDSSDVLITFNSYSNIDNFVLQLNKADYFHFQYLSFTNNNYYTGSRIIVVANGSDNNVFNNNQLLSGYNFSYGFITSGNNNNNIYRFNLITGINLGIYMQGDITGTNNVIEGNVIYTRSPGISVQYQDNIIIKNNYIESTSNGFTGIDISNCKAGSIITGNKIFAGNSVSNFNGISVNNSISNGNKKLIVSNNFISSASSNLSNSFIGIKIYNGSNVAVYLNSVYFKSTNTNSFAISFTRYKTGTYGPVDVKNNIFINNAEGYVFMFDNYAAGNAFVTGMDFNVYYTLGQYIGKYGTNSIANLKSWIALTKFDANSRFELPAFRSETDLHLMYPDNYQVNNPLIDVPDDIDGQLRSKVKPVTGADDINTFPYDIAITKLIEPAAFTCEGKSNFIINIKNKGNNKIDTFFISWKINNKSLRYDTLFTSLNPFQDINLFLETDTIKPEVTNSFYAKTKLPSWQIEGDTLNNEFEVNKITVYNSPEISNVISDTICKNTSATLEVHGNGNKYFWYESPNSDTYLLMDSVLTIHNCEQDRIFYAKATSSYFSPDSFYTVKQQVNLQSMGIMFCIKAKNKKIKIDSFGIITTVKSGFSVPVEVYFRKGSFRGFESAPTFWTLWYSDTVISNGNKEFTNIGMKSITIDKGDSVAFYITSTDIYSMLYSLDSWKNFENIDLKISNGSLVFYPFDPFFISNKSFIGMVYYGTENYCNSDREPVYLKINPTPQPNLGPDKYLCYLNKPVLDAGAGPGFSYVWKWGTNSDTISTNQKLVLDSSGIYTITVSDTCGFSASDQVFYDIKPKPVSQIEVNDSSQCLKGNNFKFTNKSTISSGQIVSTYWDFGDGDHSLLHNPEHVYYNASAYKVMMVTNSDKGCTDTLYFNNALVYEMPEIKFTVNIDQQCLNSNNFEFLNLSSVSNDSLHYRWHFGDGITSKDINPMHIYSNPGSFHVWLTAITDKECSDSIYKPVLVKPNPSNFLGNDTTVKINSQLVIRPLEQFDSYLWSDNSTLDSFIVTSAVEDKKMVWLTVSKDNCYGTDTIIVYFDSFNAIFNAEKIAGRIFPNPVGNLLFFQFDNSVEIPLSISIESLDGKTVYLEHIFNHNGNINLENLAKGIYTVKIKNKKSVFLLKIFKE